MGRNGHRQLHREFETFHCGEAVVHQHSSKDAVSWLEAISSNLKIVCKITLGDTPLDLLDAKAGRSRKHRSWNTIAKRRGEPAHPHKQAVCWIGDCGVFILDSRFEAAASLEIREGRE